MYNQIAGPIPTEIGQLAALKELRVPSASPMPGAAPDRSSASQVSRGQPDHRPDPGRDRPALHDADGPASSPASPTPGAPRDGPSASQATRREPDHRHVPARPLLRRDLPGRWQSRPRRAVRQDGLLRSRGRDGMPGAHARAQVQSVLPSVRSKVPAKMRRVPLLVRAERELALLR